MKRAIGVIGGAVIGGYAAVQLSSDAAMLGVIGGGVIGAIIAGCLGAATNPDADNGAWYDGSEPGQDPDDWGTAEGDFDDDDDGGADDGD